MSDIPGNFHHPDHRLSRRLRQRPLTSLDSGSPTPTSLYAQVDLKKKKRPPSGYLSRHLGKTKSVDPVTMTTSLSGLEVREKCSNYSEEDSLVLVEKPVLILDKS